jgi:hypothetical protein
MPLAPQDLPMAKPSMELRHDENPQCLLESPSRPEPGVNPEDAQQELMSERLVMDEPVKKSELNSEKGKAGWMTDSPRKPRDKEPYGFAETSPPLEHDNPLEDARVMAMPKRHQKDTMARDSVRDVPTDEPSGMPQDETLSPAADQFEARQGEVLEIDIDLDPPQRAPEMPARKCDFKSLSRLFVREHVKGSPPEMRARVREVLDQMENSPKVFSEEQIASSEAFLETIEKNILKAEEFVAGSFQNSYPAWQELLRDSTRQSSRKVLKWVKEGVKPIFEGVVNTEQAKLNRVRGLLRHAVPKGQVEAYLKGEIPHQIEFQNHRSVYEHWDFVVGAVEKLVVSGTAHLYGRAEGKPKVVNPLGVALNGATERLVLNGMYSNDFMKQLPFKYERLRDVLTFLKRGGYVASWDLKAATFTFSSTPSIALTLGSRWGTLTSTSTGFVSDGHRRATFSKPSCKRSSLKCGQDQFRYPPTSTTGL